MFRYEAADPTGKILRGAMEATNTQDVVARLTQRGYQQVHVVGAHSAGASCIHADLPPLLGEGGLPKAGREGAVRVAAASPEARGIFFRQMASLVNAGYTVPAALTDLGARTAHNSLKRAVKAMAAQTANGGDLASAMAAYPTLFAPHVVGLTAAGETGGFLPFAFEEAALDAEQDAALRQGRWLPYFFFWQALWSVILFQPFFPSLNPEHPLAGLAHYGRTVLFICIPLGIALHLLWWAAGVLWRQPGLIAVRDQLALRFPVMRRLARMRALAAFTRVLRRLLQSGISVETAFAAAARAVPNTVLRNQLLAGAAVVRAGGGLDQAIQAAGLLDQDPMSLLITGQKTGQMPEMLDRVAAYYQEEAARAMDSARGFQRRAAGIITLISMGYVTIYTVYGLATVGFKWTESWTQ